MNKSDKFKLRAECSRLMHCETLNESYELMDVYIEFLFQAVKNHHNEIPASQANADAKILLQMMLTKALHLKSIVKGISYQAKDGAILKEIIDPSIVSGLIRNIYETVSMFNLIYRNPKNEDEKTILYSLWVHAGLAYRQKFESGITTKENRGKFELEKETMTKLVLTIENTELFKELAEKNQNKIKTRLKEKEYLMTFNNLNVEFQNWQSLTKVMGFKNELFDTIYTHFSLNAHPSNVSVFQFASMFETGSEEFPNAVNTNLKYFFTLTSIFIADYIYVLPTVSKSFENMSIRDQIVLNFYNTLMRGNEFSINCAANAVN